jgi:ABC-type glutathione transport system ATPase component
MSGATASNVLTVSHVSASYRSEGVLGGKKGVKKVLDDVSLEIGKGEILGLAGESGSGKTTLARVVLGLLPYTGSIVKNGLTQAVFQDPASSLNPMFRIGRLVEEPLIINKRADKKERAFLVDRCLEMVGLDAGYKERRLAELSGGQQQRVAIACSLILEPSLVVADEPVSALDVTVAAQILNLFRELHDRLHLALLFISHNLDLLYYLCDKLAILNQGRIIESGPVEEVYEQPKEQYTRDLLAAAH